jgi:hypothetical protein
MTETVADTAQLLSAPLAFHLDEAVEIPMRSSAGSTAPQAKDMSLINGKTLIVADATLSVQDLADVQNSILYSQGVLSGKKISDIDEPEKWYKGFRENMGALNWFISNTFPEKYKSNEARFTLSELAIKILRGLAGNLDAAGIKTAVEAAVKRVTDFAKDANPRAEIFSRANSSTDKAGFSMGLAYPSPQGPRVDLAFFSVKLSRETKNILIATMQREETHLTTHQGALTLNVPQYAKFRQQIVDRLGNRTQKLIDSAPLNFDT